MTVMDPWVPKWAAIATLAVFFFWFGFLTSDPIASGPRRIVSLELSPTVDAANSFLQEWAKTTSKWKRHPEATPKERLLTSLQWDSWFICSYAPLFALLCWVAAGQFDASHPGLAQAGRWLSAGQLLAGALDFVENWALRHMILDEVARMPWPLLSFVAAGIKWLLIVAAGIFVAIALCAFVGGVFRTGH